MMIAVGGLLLGAVLTAPGAAGGSSSAQTLADPFDPSVPRVAIARGDEALGLRDPFGAGLPTRAMLTRRASRAAAGPDLRDPFEARARRRALAGPPAPPVQADLRSPFVVPPHSATRRRGKRRAPAPKADLRDPFGT
ncbi:MAG: hypothetical protein AAGF11_05015 [Myxococcota bacterium]